MKTKKLKKLLSVVYLNDYKKKFPFFFIKTSNVNKNTPGLIASKTLTKLLVKQIKLSNHLDSILLKYSLTINFFYSSLDMYNFLKKDSSVVFTDIGNIVLKLNNAESIKATSSINLFNRFSNLFNARILFFNCFKIAAVNNTTKS